MVMVVVWLVLNLLGGLVNCLPPNYEDIDMSVDQAIGEKVTEYF